MRGPTDEQPSAKSTLISASRKRQVLTGWQDAAPANTKTFGFANECLLLFGGDRPRLIDEKSAHLEVQVRSHRDVLIAAQESDERGWCRRIIMRTRGWKAMSDDSNRIRFSFSYSHATATVTGGHDHQAVLPFPSRRQRGFASWGTPPEPHFAFLFAFAKPIAIVIAERWAFFDLTIIGQGTIGVQQWAPLLLGRRGPQKSPAD
jgi:hypothetical protein